MISFFKNFGKGVLYVLVLPFLLVGMAIYGVVALFIFIYLAIKGLVLFFTGRSLYEDLPEDIEAKKRLAPASSNEQTPVTNEDISSALDIGQKEENTVNTSDPFYVPEYLKSESETNDEPLQEEPVQEEQLFNPEEENTFEQEPPIEEPNNNEEQMIIKPSHQEEPDVPAEEPQDEIVLEKTEQKSNILEIKDDEDDEDESSGINIDFD